MRDLQLARPGERLTVLCLGAHSDDIEIGAGATILSWIARGIRLDVHWCVLSANGSRAAEAEASRQVDSWPVPRATRSSLARSRTASFPTPASEIKAWMEGLKSRVATRCDPHAQRTMRTRTIREVSKLTWNTFRNHLILEYEIPKVGRRSWPAEFLCARRRQPDATQDRFAARAFRHAAFQGLV